MPGADRHHVEGLAEAIEEAATRQNATPAPPVPSVKTLDQFDFEFQPSIDRRQVRELAGRADNELLALARV
jgi:hypothetical protein